MYFKICMAVCVSLWLAGTVWSQSFRQSGQNDKMKQEIAVADTAKTPSGGMNAKTLTPQTTCPVTGDPIDRKLYVDYKGKRIYVCCEGCKATVAKKPEKYLKKLLAMGQAAEVIDTVTQMPQKALAPQTTCPVMGGAIDKTLYVDYQGKRIYVCCAGCISEVKKDPQKYIDKLKSMGQAVEVIASEKPAVKKEMR